MKKTILLLLICCFRQVIDIDKWETTAGSSTRNPAHSYYLFEIVEGIAYFYSPDYSTRIALLVKDIEGNPVKGQSLYSSVKEITEIIKGEAEGENGFKVPIRGYRVTKKREHKSIFDKKEEKPSIFEPRKK